jgi:phenylalanyl-tRNA synthetase beta chain
MKISLKWLNDYVDVSDYFKKTNDLADILTRAGLEVEEIKDLASDLNHVVVGYIKLKDKHPNADKLSMCQVEIAPGVIEQIVCGAQNHKTGDKVIVALPGAVLPGNFIIKKSKIRDIESNGMLCSYKEIGITDLVSDGIVILDTQACLTQNSLG